MDIPLAILDKYKGYPICEKKGTLLPVPCNQKANSYLKEIADFCGIKKNLTTHTGRHTFSTVVTLANNVSLENVSKMLGHTNTKMTQRYAKVLDQSILRDMQNVRENFSPKPPKDKNGYPIHSDGSRFSIFIILKAKENNLLYYRQNETYLPKPSLYPIHETALCPEVE